ncbi:MAG: allantoicase [Actinomycetota bacterium]|nr:allantoicase [Actinomycetota bacterium]
MGGSVVFANDELFAERENLIKPEPAAYSTYTFGHKGQVYDGWETRRRREPGHDFALVRLGQPGVVRGVVVDTAFFKGNYPPEVSVEGCSVDGYPSPPELADADWVTVVPRSAVQGDTANAFAVEVDQRLTHVRLCMYPDGGIARLRVHGEVVPDPRLLTRGAIDLAALSNGATVTGCSNMFYSSPTNLIAPGEARLMGEGWETSRRRDDGNDWVQIKLAGPGVPRLLELDTRYFLGNAPGWASVRGYDSRHGAAPDGEAGWTQVLPRTRLQPDTRHQLRVDVGAEITDLRLDVYPDGGMARFRVFGELAPTGREELALRWFGLLSTAQTTAIARAAGWDQITTHTLIADRPHLTYADLPEPLRAQLEG